MSEINEKRLYFIIVCMGCFLILSIAAFLFLFGEWQSSTLNERVHFLGWDFTFFCIFLFASVLFSNEIYK